jgi:hypothetical protein
MQIQIKDNCPLNKFKPCKKTDCAWYIQVRGKNPQTGADVDEFACAIAWFPVLMIENSQQQRQTGAAVESFRNEMVKANESTQKLMYLASNMQRIGHE